MKNKLLLLSAFILIALNPNAFAQKKNLLLNGGFEEGINRWLGERKIETIDGNKVAVVEAGDSRKDFHQAFTGRGLKSVDIKLRYKPAKDYKGSGFTIIVYAYVSNDYISDEVTSFKIPISKNNDEWKDVKVKYDRFNKMISQYTFKVEMAKGKGKIYFDDISVTESEEGKESSADPGKNKPANNQEQAEDLH
jgi:hypothetical protein